jgi:hypothetical protein
MSFTDNKFTATGFIDLFEDWRKQTNPVTYAQRRRKLQNKDS